MVENGAVRTYEGHNNTHTMLQLGVDPTETLLVSGNSERPPFLILPCIDEVHGLATKFCIIIFSLHVCVFVLP
jgi:hypothetical protein